MTYLEPQERCNRFPSFQINIMLFRVGFILQANVTYLEWPHCT